MSSAAPPSSPLTPAILFNPRLSPKPLGPWYPPPSILPFHRSLPDYQITPLTPLPTLSSTLGLNSVLVKDESLRLGLPAFKILGASWAVHRAVCKTLNLSVDTSLSDLTTRVKEASSSGIDGSGRRRSLRLLTSTDGNWGRGVARMGKYLGVEVLVFVPRTMDEGTRERIRGEGAVVKGVDGDYDLSVKEAEREVGRRDEGTEEGEVQVESLLVQDVAWPGYEEIPTWVVEGYSTMLRELDDQIANQLGLQARIDLVVASVGVGSFAQAVTMHFKSSPGHETKVVVVEPTTAACLRRSLQEDKITSIDTEDTIMCGMNCGTVSTTSWPVLRAGVDAAVVVTDREAHEAVGNMEDGGVRAGPCGAATLAALRKVVEDGGLGLGRESNVVLFCTEGTRPYEVPVT